MKRWMSIFILSAMGIGLGTLFLPYKPSCNVLVERLGIRDGNFNHYDSALKALQDKPTTPKLISILVAHFDNTTPTKPQIAIARADGGPVDYSVGDLCLWIIQGHLCIGKKTLGHDPVPTPPFFSDKVAFASWWTANKHRPIPDLQKEILIWRIKEAEKRKIRDDLINEFRKALENLK